MKSANNKDHKELTNKSKFAQMLTTSKIISRNSKKPWSKFLQLFSKTSETPANQVSKETAKTYVKFSSDTESIYGEKIYTRHINNGKLYRQSARQEELYNESLYGDSHYRRISSNNSKRNLDSSAAGASSDGHYGVESEYSGGNASSYNKPGDERDYGTLPTASSSNSSVISSNRLYRPPSLFSDSRELSEAECDRDARGGQEKSQISEKQTVRVLEKSKTQNNDANDVENCNELLKPNANLSTPNHTQSLPNKTEETEIQENVETVCGNEELTVILNRIYEHQHESSSSGDLQENLLTNRPSQPTHESIYTSESEKSTYSINV